MTEFIVQKDILVATEVWPLLQRAGLTNFDAFMGLSGGRRVVHKRGRSVFRFEIGERAFYLKRNRLHPLELLKQLSRGKLPPRGALQEWTAIQAVTGAGISTVKPVAFGECRFLGVETASFTVTEELYGSRPLDELILEKSEPLDSHHGKRELIKKVANLARCLHNAGMNHQDFYLNHFFLDEKGVLSLLDLQRVQSRERVPDRFMIKDLAQLAFSARRFPAISRSDHLRFLLAYRGEKRVSRGSRHLLSKVQRKVRRIARHDVKLTVRRRARGEMS